MVISDLLGGLLEKKAGVHENAIERGHLLVRVVLVHRILVHLVAEILLASHNSRNVFNSQQNLFFFLVA